MIHLIRSHNLRTLAKALAEKLAESAPDDPFVSQKIIVPNLDTARWFKLFAAEQNGIAANLECMLPAEWLWKQIRKIHPDLPELLPSDLQPMKWTLFELLSDPKARKEFEVLNRYVESQPDERREQAAFQLAGQIASVFDEYLVYRPEMVLRWQKGHSGKGDEKWQSELWRMLNESWNNDYKNRAELYDEVMTVLSKNEHAQADTLYILNPGLLPVPLVKMLRKTGESSNVFFFQVQLSKQVGENLCELFQVFGVESVKADEVINNLGSDERVELHSEPRGNNPLHRIQSDIINGNSINNLPEIQDKIPGIEIRSCHSPLREIEVLYQFLLEKFEEDETLHPDDILVVTPDLESCRPYIKAVFDQVEEGLPQIPYHAGYSSRSSDVGIERALLRLLSLIDSRFEYSSVIDLFMMRPVYQSFGISESDCRKLRQWIEENHVVWGLNAEHRKEFDQPAEELQTWNSAVRRGWYGNLFGGEQGDSLDDLLLYQSIRTANDQAVWAAFSNYIYQLSTMRKEVKRKKTCPDWSEWLSNKMDSLFDAASLGSVEAQSIRRMIGQISEQSVVAAFDQEVSFALFKSELTSMLDGHKASGALFTNGVTFSSMVPVRSIPFKVIALIGLNESSFPRKKITPDFDLMAQNPMPGERNRKSEDRNLFLESIMAAGDVHYCSYIGQSKEDNEEIPPSTIVSEWVDVLSKASGIESKKIIKKEAISGFSPANFESKKNYSGVYLQTARLMLDDDNSTSGLKLDDPIPLEESGEPIQLDDLVRFYSNPIQWFLRKRFEVSLRETDQEKDEFQLDHLERHILFQRVFGWVLDGMSDQQIQKYLIQSGAVPVGWPGKQKVLELKGNVRSAISVLNQMNIQPKLDQYPVSISVGENQIEGSLTSYSDHRFVDINPSKFSGKVAIISWIRHLFGLESNQFEKRDSILFCELKEGEPRKKVFTPVQNSSEILEGLIGFYRKGLTQPQTFFPRSLFEFEITDRNEKGKSDPLKKAINEFQGDFQPYPERNDLSIQTLLGPEVNFKTEFVSHRYRHFIRQMMDHMEEG